MVLFTSGKHRIPFQIDEEDYQIISLFTWIAQIHKDRVYIQAHCEHKIKGKKNDLFT